MLGIASGLNWSAGVSSGRGTARRAPADRSRNSARSGAASAQQSTFVYVDMPHGIVRTSDMTSGSGKSKLDLLQGTLDLMVLQTLAAMGSLHGYGVARRIEQLSGDEVLLNQGTIYAALVRLQQRGWIDADWGVSDSNRRAKFYSITKTGRKQLKDDRSEWLRLSAVMSRVLAVNDDRG